MMRKSKNAEKYEMYAADSLEHEDQASILAK